MPLASDDIVIDVSPAITLRPSLRAAYRLERKYDDLNELLGLVSSGSVAAISDVIREGAGESSVTRYLDESELPLHIDLEKCADGAEAFIFALVGYDPHSPKPNNEPVGKPIPLREHFVNLFRFATGWLHWTPEQAWAAYPAEILEAQKGHIEMLIATGVLKKSEEIDLTKIDPSERRAALSRIAAIGNMNNHVMPR